MSITFGAVTNRAPMNHDHQVQPVRRNSRLRGHCEAGFWRAVSRREGWSLVVLAKRYEKLRKEAGKKNGPLGTVAIEVLEYMVNLIDHRTGRLETFNRDVDAKAQPLTRCDLEGTQCTSAAWFYRLVAPLCADEQGGIGSAGTADFQCLPAYAAAAGRTRC